MNKIRFVTLHPAGTNVDLMKDEGQIPYTLCTKNATVDATIVTCHINNKTANLNAVSGLKVKHFPFIFNNALTGIIFILLNAKKIEWLNIYFAGRQAYYWTKLYKRLNKKGKVYLKLDMDFRSSELYEKNPKEAAVFKKNTEVIDLVSVESKALKDRIQKYSTKDIILIGNGVSKLDFEPMTNQERENIFLTVARLGTVQKATDILLEAFAKSADKHNWDLKLIGTVEKEFRPYIEEYYKKYPELKSRVHFVGQIKNRELLYNEYCRAKVFVLPSRWESYGISCAEALSCGCRLILTDTIPPAKELTNNERYGKIIEANNVDALSEAIIGAVNQEYTQLDIDERVQYANAKFSWEKICATLYDAMEKVDSKKGNEQER